MQESEKNLNILITNDDGIDAPGIKALFDAVRHLGTVHVVAPRMERSACSHTITLYRPVVVERIDFTGAPSFDSDRRVGDGLARPPSRNLKSQISGRMSFSVEGTPADCVRLGCTELLDAPVDLVVSGINRGANAGVDVYYSGTIAAAREGAILGVQSISVSQAIRQGVEVDWEAAARITRRLVQELARESLPEPGFWSVNLPAPIPADPMTHVRRVPVAPGVGPTNFERTKQADGRVEYRYGGGYWDRDTPPDTDYGVIRDGGIAVSAIPLWARF